ncbi:MAG: hypothetical protein QT05_C0025G0006 [archaeon GW2011_AR13]|nr:MAG: hypothetical protein QT05_C0025G0006 [archaeon GW2011_AR13]HIG94458.1 hypothetical protein [Nanoarchaeota archaeon]HIH62968.1 hypothetical protein [Nanoarchaeota archaeon]HIJ10233.1 hypothetical protein [Nanoarchaeota archaeon]
MEVLNLFGLLFSTLGVVYLAFGFRFGKPKYLGDYTYEFDGKEPLVLYYENSFLRIVGWICLGFGNILQIASIFS